MSDNAWQKWKKSLGSTRPWDFVDPRTPLVSDEIAKNRYSICEECPKFIKITKQCQECLCFMVAKTKLEKATCPLHKW